MARAPSFSRQLVVSIGVPLVLAFALTVWALDRIFRNRPGRALRERLDEEIIALVTAAELNEEGRMDVRLADPESRLSSPGSGHYALVRNQRGRELWRSPSLAGRQLDFGSTLATGKASFFQQRMADGSPDCHLQSWSAVGLCTRQQRQPGVQRRPGSGQPAVAACGSSAASWWPGFPG